MQPKGPGVESPEEGGHSQSAPGNAWQQQSAGRGPSVQIGRSLELPAFQVLKIRWHQQLKELQLCNIVKPCGRDFREGQLQYSGCFVHNLEEHQMARHCAPGEPAVGCPEDRWVSPKEKMYSSSMSQGFPRLIKEKPDITLNDHDHSLMAWKCHNPKHAKQFWDVGAHYMDSSCIPLHDSKRLM